MRFNSLYKYKLEAIAAVPRTVQGKFRGSAGKFILQLLWDRASLQLK